MRAIEATFIAKEFVRDVLILAGLKDGFTKTSAQIQTEKTTMFWFVHLVDENAAKKEAYIVYNIEETTPKLIGDGEVFGRQVNVQMDIYTRKRDNQELLETIEDKFKEKSVDSFEMAKPIDYNPSTKMYQYSIIIQLMASDSEPVPE